MAHFRDC